METDHNAVPSQPGPSGDAGAQTPREGAGLPGEAGAQVPREAGAQPPGAACAHRPGAAPAPYSRRVVPPGSSALREFLLTVVSALDVQPPNEARDIAAYRYLLAARARAVRHTARRLLDDREADDEDVMIAVWSLRDQLSDLTPTYVAHPLASLRRPSGLLPPQPRGTAR